MIQQLRRFFFLAFAVLALANATAVRAADNASEYVLGAGDTIRINVFQNPDLTVETRVSESGTITFPLIGNVAVSGLTIPAAEQKIAKQLRAGGFVLKPQVNILVLTIRGSQVAVLGQVNRPGRYPLEIFNSKVTDMLAIAGGITPAGGDTIVLVGTRDGKAFRKEIDVPALFLTNKLADDILVAGGDIIYVHRAPMFYIYGEVQRPGVYRLEREMTVIQGLAQGGGLTLRGTERGLRISRRGADGKTQEITPSMVDPIHTDDVIYVRESLF
jgi:polysaccharide export outer membrane protein